MSKLYMSYSHQSFDTYLKSELAKNVNRVMPVASSFGVHHHSVDRMSVTDDQCRGPMNSRKIILLGNLLHLRGLRDFRQMEMTRTRKTGGNERRLDFCVLPAPEIARGGIHCGRACIPSL